MKHIKGNLLDFPEGINVVLHQANCQHIMGAGIAAQIKARYPEAFEADRVAHAKGENQLGLFSVAKLSGEPPRWIANIYGQDDLWGKHNRATNYEALYNGLDKLIEVATASGKPRIFGVPKYIGCGLAGGDWGIVEAMLIALEKKYGIEIVCVEYDLLAAPTYTKN